MTANDVTGSFLVDLIFSFKDLVYCRRGQKRLMALHSPFRAFYFAAAACKQSCGENESRERALGAYLQKKVPNDPLTPQPLSTNSSPVDPVTPLNLVRVFGATTPTHSSAPPTSPLHWHFSSICLSRERLDDAAGADISW